MKKSSWFAISVTLLIIIIVNIPIFYFQLKPVDDLTFLGRLPINSQDLYTYLSFIEQGKDGKLLFSNLYTSESQTPSLFRPSYLLIGKAAHLLNITSLDSYTLFRIIFSFLFCFTLYKFLRYFFSKQYQLFAYIFVLTSSGFGIIASKYLPSSIDLWIPEGNTFLSLFEAPHFILSQTLMLAGFIFFLRYLDNKKFSSLMIFTTLFLFLSFEHPFNLFIIAPTLFLTAISTGVPFFTAGIISGISSIGLGYQAYEAFTNTILKSWQAQNILSSPAPLSYLSGYGLLTPIAIWGSNHILKKPLSPALKLIMFWTISTVLLLYIPLNFQRRFIEGFHIPLTILATIGIISIYEINKIKTTVIQLGIIILVFGSTSWFVLTNNFKIINQDSGVNYFYHIQSSEQKAILWLKNNSKEDEVILSNSYFGNLIPGLISRPVFIGHNIQTIDFQSKINLIDGYIANQNIEQQEFFLKSNSIRYIFFSHNDSLFTKFDPYQLTNLENIYSENDVQIFQVKD